MTNTYGERARERERNFQLGHGYGGHRGYFTKGVHLHNCGLGLFMAVVYCPTSNGEAGEKQWLEEQNTTED